MDKRVCEEAVQCAAFFCECRDSPELGCVGHHSVHSARTHAFKQLNRPLTGPTLSEVQRISDCLKLLVKTYLSYTLRELAKFSSSTVLFGDLAHPECLEIINRQEQPKPETLKQALVSVSHLLGALKRLRCSICKPHLKRLGRVYLECRNKSQQFSQADQNKLSATVWSENRWIHWVTEALESQKAPELQADFRRASLKLFSKAVWAKANGEVSHAIELFVQCLAMRKMQEAKPRWEEATQRTNAQNRDSILKATAQFGLLLENFVILEGPVEISDILYELDQIQGEITTTQLFETFFRLLSHQFPQQSEEYLPRLSQLALVTLENSLICLEQSSESVQMVLKHFPFVEVDSGRYQFLEPSLRDFLVAKEIIKELETPSLLSPRCIMNTIILQADTRKSLVEMTQSRKALFEDNLVSIVLQTRYRDDITQAASNAMTLLNQLKYCFVRKDFSKVKIKGANLCGADLTQTNLSKSDLTGVTLVDCRLLNTRLKRTILTHVKYTAHSVFPANSSRKMCLSSDGRYAIYRVDTPNVSIWNTITGQQLYTFMRQSVCSRGACLSEDAKFMAFINRDLTVEIWAAHSGQLLCTLLGHLQSVTALCFSFTLFFSGSSDRTVIAWEFATGTKLYSVSGHSSDVIAVTASADGTLAASSSQGNEVMVWTTATGQRLCTVYCSVRGISVLCFSSDGKMLGTQSRDYCVELWEISTAHRIHLLRYGLGMAVQPNGFICFSPDGSLIASNATDRCINVWSTKTGRRIHTTPEYGCPIDALRFTSNAELQVSGRTLEGLVTWIALVDSPRRLQGHTSFVTAVEFSPDGRLLASGSSDRSIILWDVASMQVVRELCSSSAWTLALCFSPDNALFAVVTRESSVIIWRVATGEEEWRADEHSGSLLAARFSSDGRWLVTGGIDTKVILWDLTERKITHIFEESSTWISAVGFSSDCTMVAAGTRRLEIFIWGTLTGQLLYTLCNRSSTLGVPFPSNTSLLALSEDEGTLMLVDIASNSHIREFVDHVELAGTVGFMPSSGLVFSGNAVYQVVVWDFATAEILQVFGGHRADLTSISASPDGKFIVSAGEDRTFAMINIKREA